jgi:hypothetical protein
VVRLSSARVALVIPVLDEAEGLALVLPAIPKTLVDTVIVVDNGSTDGSAAVALRYGATVVAEPRRGYGAACLRGIEMTEDHDIVVFLDGDYSDHPEEIEAVLRPLLAGDADMVVGSRMIDPAARQALLPQARYGNRLAAVLMRALFGIRCTDLGPFRAIRRDALMALRMQDRDFGWTVEMQLRARLRGLRVVEIPVRYRKRIGTSKISGTFVGTLRASYKILKTIFVYRLRPPRWPQP